MKELTCIVCPRGCRLTVREENETIKVTGNACPRGESYAVAEVTHPVRTVTSTMRVDNREDCMVSVKTAVPVSKERMREVVERLRGLAVSAPIEVGQILAHDICGSEIVATKEIV